MNKEVGHLVRNLFLAASIAGCASPRPSTEPTHPTIKPSPRPTSTEMVDMQEINMRTARSVLSRAGVGASFKDTEVDVMLAANAYMSSDTVYDNTILGSFYNKDGNLIGIALDGRGEIINVSMGSDNAFHLRLAEAVDSPEPDKPSIVFTFSEAENQKSTYVIVGYGDKAKNDKLIQILESDEVKTKNFLTGIFAHSDSKLKVLHLADNGMPVSVFNYPGNIDPHLDMKTTSLPTTTAEGSQVTASVAQVPLRTDIFVSLPQIRVRAQELSLPPVAEFAGTIANESYGSALSSFNAENNKSKPLGRYEAGSTATYLGTLLQVSEGVEGSFFSQDSIKLLGEIYDKLSVGN